MAKRFAHTEYKHHRPCRKASVHAIFDKDGADAALVAAKKFGIKESSARTWISGWKRGIGDCASARAFIEANQAKRAKRSAARKRSA